MRRHHDHHAARVVRPGLRRARVSRSACPVLTQQAQLFGLAVDGAKNPFVPKLDLPNVIPSTFSDLAARTARRSLAYSAIGQYNDQLHRRCRTRWWRPGSPTAG